jgi:hypothetical protein
LSDLEINTLEDIGRVVSFAKGINPDTQQTLNEFLKFDNNIERTTLPKRQDVKRMIYADYAGRVLYPDTPDNPFTRFAEAQSIAFMAYKGNKSEQFVQLMQQTPNLTALQSLPSEQKQGFVNKILGRSETE